MTIAGFSFPSVKAAQEVRPMNGGIAHLSTVTLISLRGTLTLKTPSSSFHFPLSPVTSSIRAMSSFSAPRSAGEIRKAKPNPRALKSVVFMFPISLFCNTCYCTVTRLQKQKEFWLLLLYGLPTKRTTARVNLWRKLKKFGAIQLKTSAWLLPDTPVHYERFQWLATQIRDDGGEATLLKVAEIGELSPQQIHALFNNARAAEYRALIKEIQGAMLRNRKGAGGPDAPPLERFQRALNEIKQIDYFQCPKAHDAEMSLQRMTRLIAGKRKDFPREPTLSFKDFIGRTWLTRPRPGIDRAGSAWLIRKFIDPKAKFLFAMEPSKFPQALPFDMAGVEFS